MPPTKQYGERTKGVFGFFSSTLGHPEVGTDPARGPAVGSARARHCCAGPGALETSFPSFTICICQRNCAHY